MPLHKTPTGLPSGYAPDQPPGHWELHHIALPGNSPGDFTPVRRPDYAEENISPLDQLVEAITGAPHAGRVDLGWKKAGPKQAYDREAQ